MFAWLVLNRPFPDLDSETYQPDKNLTVNEDTLGSKPFFELIYHIFAKNLEREINVANMQMK